MFIKSTNKANGENIYKYHNCTKKFYLNAQVKGNFSTDSVLPTILRSKKSRQQIMEESHHGKMLKENHIHRYSNFRNFIVKRSVANKNIKNQIKIENFRKISQGKN